MMTCLTCFLKNKRGGGYWQQLHNPIGDDWCRTLQSVVGLQSITLRIQSCS